MKRNLFKALLFVSLIILSVKTIKAQCSLDQIGAPNYTTTSQLADMAVTPGGTVYTISFNSSINKFQLHAAVASSSWSLVAVISTSTTVKPAIAISKLGKLSVLIRDENAGKVAKLYYLSGGTLIQQGAAISSGQVSDLSLAFNAAGEEVVAYTDISNSNIATVKKWNSGSSVWVNVGSGTVSPGAAAYNSIMVDKSDFPVLAYQDATTAPINKIAVKRYNGSTWVSLGVVSVNSATNAKLKVANNSTNYYLGYTEPSNSSAIVQMYNGSSWSALGSPVNNLSTAANTFGFDLDPIDTPAFTTILSTPPYPVAYKYSAGAWNVLVSYINSSTAVSTNIQYDATGSPYYFFVDQPANYALNVRKTSTPVSISTQPTSTITCNGGGMGYFYTGTVGGTPGYQWQVSSAGGFFANAGTTYTNATGPSVTFNPVTAMNQDVVRCVVNAGCINLVSATATLSVNTLSVASTSTNPTCYNTSNGAISTTVTGGSTPYTYTWSPIGGNAATATGLYGTTYTLNTTDNIGCTTAQTIALTTPPSINSSFSGNQTFCDGSSTTMTVIASGGIGSFTYSWTPSVNITPTTGSVVTMNPSSSITYGVQITDSIGCIATNTVGVGPLPLPTVSASATSSVICNGATTTLMASGSADTYTWNPGNIASASVVVSPSAPTIYTVTGTNTLTGCTNTASVSITVNPLPTANAGPAQTLTCANPTATLSGSSVGGVSYSWTGFGIVSGAATANPVVNSVGTYDLTVVSAAGCSSSMVNTSVSQNTVAPSPSASTTGTITCSSLTVAVNGTPGTGVTYLWSGPSVISGATSQNASVSAAGIYTLTVTSAVNGCTNTANTTVTQNTVAPSPSATNSGALTCAVTTATLTGLPSTGVTYQWSGPGITGSTITRTTTANAGGTYSLLVTSSVNGCTNIATTAVTQNTTAPSPTAGTTGTLTCSTSNVTLNGGPGTGVTYLWSGPGITGGTTTQNTTANAAGTYSLKVTGSVNGCTNTAVATVTQNTVAPSPTANTTGSITCTTATVALNGTPGTGVTYLWTGPNIVSGSSTQNPIAGAAGTYSLLVTNTTNGCTATATTAVSQNTTSPVATAGTAGSSITCTFANANLYGGPFSGVSYLWSGPGVSGSTTTQNTTAGIVGTYTLLVTNLINGCTGTATTSVTQNTTPPSVTAVSGQSITCSTPSVSLNASSSADPSTTYTWTSAFAGTLDNYNISNPNAFASGIYTVSVSDINNGCIATTTVEVFSDVALPATIVNFSPTNTLTCTDPSISAIATTTTTTVMFSWLGSGITSGASTATATINQPGMYSVTVTNTVNGCATTETVTVSQDITPPVFSVNASPSTICSGNSTSITATGANTYSWSSGQTSAGITDSPATTTVYTVTGYAVNGCSDVMTETVTVNATPLLSVTGATNICKGSTANLIANGAISYTWSTGANTAAISETPTVTTTYTVTGDNGACTSSLTPVVSIITSKDISGTITSTTGATTGDVILYKYTAALSHWDSVTVVPFSSSYTFTNIDSALYVVRAMPTATNIQVTYGDSAVSWQDAKIINHGCTNNTTENIKLMALTNIGTGPGQLSGTIIEGNGFGHRISSSAAPLVPGNPIGGIIVKGGKNPGGAMFSQTTTNASGQYTLTGIPLSTGLEDYFIFVDIPGLDTNLTYHTIISSGNPVITNLDFYVDSMYINPVYVTKVKEENALFENRIVLYPNPANQYFSIQYELINDSEVTVELYDMIGKKVSTLVPHSKQSKNKYDHRIETGDLNSGVYFVKLKLNGNDTTIKLILTK